MSKIKPKSKNLNSFFLIILFIVFLLFLSFLNVNFYFKQNEDKVLSAQEEAFNEEEYWINFLKDNSNYLPGYLELTKIQIKNGDINKARQTILKAKELNPNSPEIIKLEENL